MRLVVEIEDRAPREVRPPGFDVRPSPRRAAVEMHDRDAVDNREDAALAAENAVMYPFAQIGTQNWRILTSELMRMEPRDLVVAVMLCLFVPSVAHAGDFNASVDIWANVRWLPASHSAPKPNDFISSRRLKILPVGTSYLEAVLSEQKMVGRQRDDDSRQPSRSWWKRNWPSVVTVVGFTAALTAIVRSSGDNAQCSCLP